FIQTDANLHVYVIHGFALLTDDAVYVPAGAWISPGQPAAPFEPDQWAALPLHLLPVSVRLPEAITVEDIDRLENEYTATRDAVSATPAPLPTTDPMLCQREIRRDTSLYAGPGAF